MAKPLNAGQLRFVLEYLVDQNATQAAQRAGYSKKTAYSQGQRLLKHDEVKKYLAKATKEQHDRLNLKADDILRALYEIVSVDVIDLFDEDGAMKKLKDIPAAARKAISSIEVDEIWEYEGEERVKIGETKKIKFWNKVQSAELLGKNLKLFIDRLEIDRKISIEEALELVKPKFIKMAERA